MPAALALIAALACGSEEQEPNQRGDFGPLAVFDGEGLGRHLASGGTGRVDIGDNCVTIHGGTLLLVWGSTDVRWDEAKREITFTEASNRERDPITIRDGDTITIGGAGWPDDVPRERNITWLAEPHESCPTQQWATSFVSKP